MDGVREKKHGRRWGWWCRVKKWLKNGAAAAAKKPGKKRGQKAGAVIGCTGTLAGLHACRFTTVEWMDEMRIQQGGGGISNERGLIV